MHRSCSVSPLPAVIRFTAELAHHKQFVTNQSNGFGNRWSHSAASGSPKVQEFLVDSFQRQHNYLRISITERCNLRCQYCMPEEGVSLQANEAILTAKEIEKLAQLFIEAGVTKIRLTGGEPLVRKDVEDIAERIGSLPGLKHLAMTTNGLLLTRKLPKLKAAGLNQLNISLDTFSAERFVAISRRLGHDKVLQGIELALSMGYEPLKINCVVMKGVNDDELDAFVRWTKDRPVQVRFIEFMPFDDNKWTGDKVFSYADMLKRVKSAFPDLERVTDAPNDTAKQWRVPGYRGSIGFISSMTDHFCGTCNRLRLTADGNLKVCLFGAAEISLRNPLRRGASDDELRAIIGSAVKRKKERHGGLFDMYDISQSKNRPMILIGG